MLIIELIKKLVILLPNPMVEFGIAVIECSYSFEVGEWNFPARSSLPLNGVLTVMQIFPVFQLGRGYPRFGIRAT